MTMRCRYGSGKQNMAKCPMIYIHWPGYYPTEADRIHALANLCPNRKIRVYHYTTVYGGTLTSDNLSVLLEWISMDLAETEVGDSIDVAVGEMTQADVSRYGFHNKED